jgi:hypothetical protein
MSDLQFNNLADAVRPGISKGRRHTVSRGRKPCPESFDALEAKARRELDANRRAIDATVRGIPSGKSSTWRLGKGLGATRA